jgi:hypothetical protein
MLESSQLTGNSASGGGSDASVGLGYGGAIFNVNGSVVLNTVTYSGNTYAPGHAGGTTLYNLSHDGGNTAAEQVSKSTVTLQNTPLSTTDGSAVNNQVNGTASIITLTPIYTWISAAAPPPRAITAPDAPNRAVCRGTGDYGRPWSGYWDGTRCLGSYAGNTMPATNNLQFLTSVQLAASWISGTGKIVPGNIGTVPSNTIDAGNTYTNTPQVLCSQAGYVGWVYENQCAIGASGLSMQENATVLVGTVQ